MNVWNGIGRLVRDVEIKATATTLLANFTLAVDNPFGKTENNTKTYFIACVAFGKTAEFIKKYVSVKGVRIGVNGSLQTRNWEDKEGKKHYVTEVVANNVYFADGKVDNANVNQNKKPEVYKTDGEEGNELPI